MSKVTRTIMMRKTKTVLIDMLEEQRQIIVAANNDRDSQIHKVMQKNTRINGLCNDIQELEAKHEHLITKHSTLNMELGRKDREINQLKDAYIDKLELAVDLYERIL